MLTLQRTSLRAAHRAPLSFSFHAVKPAQGNQQEDQDITKPSLFSPAFVRRTHTISAICTAALLPSAYFHHFFEFITSPAGILLAATSGRAPRIVDDTLALAVPLHFYIGCSKIVQDYVYAPKARKWSLWSIGGISMLAAVS